MSDPQNSLRFQQERYLTLDSILGMIEKHTKAATPMLITDIHTLSPGALKQSADKEAWELMARGIRHLKDGAPGGNPGSMTEALSRASLRSSALATSLGVKAPQFEQMYFNVDYSTGHEAAIFYTKRLTEAAEGDSSKSRQIIQQKIYTEKPFGAFGIMTDMDPELRDIFDAVRQSTGVTPQQPAPKHNIPAEDINAMRKQMVTSFNMLVESYAEVCKTLHAEVASTPAPILPKPSNKGHSFDL